MQNFYDLTFDQLKQFLVEKGEPAFRAQQLFRWVYGLRVTDPEKMTNISKTFRAQIPQLFDFSLLKIVSDLISVDGTRKFLFDIGDNKTVESVLIPSKGRLTLCISSEVGCNMACKFCFTGKQKLQRRLTLREIMAQFIQSSDALGDGLRITNIVFMGMGEPLDNPEAVFNSVEVLNNTWGLNFSRKKITVSTSGIVPMMPLITRSGTRLAVSLNGVNDTIRSEIMPINKKWPIEELLQACREHVRESGDRVTFEYVLLKGATDSIEDARALYHLTKDIPCKINIIPFNEHPNSGFQRPDERTVDRFQNELMKLGAHVLRRKTMGRDIYAACGQLTSAYKEHPMTFSV